MIKFPIDPSTSTDLVVEASETKAEIVVIDNDSAVFEFIKNGLEQKSHFAVDIKILIISANYLKKNRVPIHFNTDLGVPKLNFDYNTI